MKKKAFTLVELVIVLILLSIGLVTLLLVLRNASINNATAHFMTVAGELTESKIEEIISDRKTRGFDYIKNVNYKKEDPISGFPNFRREVNIQNVSLSNLNSSVGTSSYKRVEVTVSSKAGVSMDARLVTLVSNY